MSDIRFVIIGILVIFTGFLILGIFGEDFQISNVEASEFENCYEYSTGDEPIVVDCSTKRFNQNIFFGSVMALIIGGILSLIKGVKGDWDSRVKPQDMVGPSRDNRSDENNP